MNSHIEKPASSSAVSLRGFACNSAGFSRKLKLPPEEAG